MIPRLRVDSKAGGRPAVLPVFQTAGDPVWPRRAAAWPKSLLTGARDDGFTGKIGETHLISGPNAQASEKILLVGLGKKESADGQSLRLFGAGAYRRLRSTRWTTARFLIADDVIPAAEAARAVAEGVGLAAYRFDKHQSEKTGGDLLNEIVFDAPTPDLREAMEGVRLGTLWAEAVACARDLINEPPSRKTPVTLGRWAQQLAGGRLRVRVYDKRALQKMGAGALLGVNRGSAHPPVLVHLRYTPAGKPKRRIAFVGKGITFDSGGLSLKPADGMMTMKYDMAGAATVFSLFKILPRLAPDIEVHGVTPVTENMPGPDAYKPGDVVTALNGKTIEVLNTDAEGRVVLADALTFATRLDVEEIVDVATLTGAATVALGKNIAACLSNTPRLTERLRAAADAAGEKLWPLPLETTYREHLRSKVADLKNIGNPGEAGTIIGGLFLEEFVAGKPWAHIDMAGVGWNAAGTPTSAPGATGAVVRTFLNYLWSLHLSQRREATA